MVEVGIPGLGDGVPDRSHPRRVGEPPLVHGYLLDRHLPSSPIERLEAPDEPADIHDLVRPRRRRGELVDRVVRRESLHGERDLEQVVGAVVQIDGVGEWRVLCTGGAWHEEHRQEEEPGSSGHRNRSCAGGWRTRKRPGAAMNERAPATPGFIT